MRLPFAGLFLVFASLVSAATPPGASTTQDHTFAFLRVGPKRAEVQGEALQEAMRGHMANIGRLAAETKLAVAGPFGAPSPDPALRGIFVFFTADAAEAAALCQTDPSISAGVLAAEVVPFRTGKNLADVLRRAMAFEERRKADPSIKMTEGMSGYVMVLADDFTKAAAALAPLRGAGSIALEGSFGGVRAGQGVFVLDAKDVAAGEALLAPLREALGAHRLFPWYGSVELKRGGAATALLAASPSVPARLSYPPTQRGSVVDEYFGTKVADPYRWLEHGDSAEVRTWVEAQNKVTAAHLEGIPFRAQVKQRLTQLLNYPKYTAPVRRGDQFIFSKNDGLQNQSVFYIQRGLDGPPEVLLDPNKFSADGTSRLGAFSLSASGRHIVFGISKGGSDWNDLYVLDVATKERRTDRLEWIKNGGGSWYKDEGFFYSRYPATEKGKELTTKNEFQAVYFHRLGQPQSADELVYEDKAHPQRFHRVAVTEDQRFAILTISERGKGMNGNALFFRDLSTQDKSFTPIVAEIGNHSYRVIDSIDGQFLIETDQGAPNRKVVRYDPRKKNWTDVLPEKPEPLEDCGTAGGKLFASYLKDVITRAYVYSLDGKLEHEIQLPGLGSAAGFGGRNDDTFVFYTYTSFDSPPTTYRYDIATRKSAVFRSVEIKGYNPADYEVKQVFFTSKDGTRVPMFLTHKKGLVLNGQNPVLMYGYGGFKNTLRPAFSAQRIALLEQGIVYVSVNLRGGAEYGAQWHEAGTKLKKQNVFDDFIAAAEYLIQHRYTTPARLAIEGASNGGLLVGAVANQRPELFRAVHQHAGVMDMLRYHTFTIGWNWAPDYGRSDANSAEFKALHAYSPVHNAKPGTHFPAILITTADHDDRVVPAHSFKYAAAVQAAQAGPLPVVIRIDTKSGHGASSVTKQIEQTADIYSFFFSTLGVTPRS